MNRSRRLSKISAMSEASDRRSSQQRPMRVDCILGGALQKELNDADENTR